MEPVEPTVHRIPRNFGKLTTRDFEIIRYILENRFATIDTVEGRFWNGSGNRNHYRTLYRLTSKGLLAPLLGDGGRVMGYSATRKAVTLFRSRGITDLKTRDLRSAYRTTFDHEKILQELRGIFESSGLVSDFEPEHMVRERLTKKYGYVDRQDHGYKIPDATFRLRTIKGAFRVALELEIAQKSRRRYCSVLKRLLLGKDWDVVFLVVAEESVLTKIRAELQGLKAQDLELRITQDHRGMYFAHLPDVLSRHSACPFEGEGKSFSLESLEHEIRLSSP